MANYIETKLRYDKMSDNGVVKKVNEHYLVDALTFTEAETRIIEEMQPYISGEMSVSAVKKTKIGEVFFNEDADKNYLVKVSFITIDERTGAEKCADNLILVQANDFIDAYDKFIDGMKGTIADFEIRSISESPILEVFKVKLSDDVK